MQLTLKQYKIIKLTIAFVLAFAISQSIVFKNFFIPVILTTIGLLLLIYFKRQVKDIMADERDWATGGRSALLSIQIYSWISVVFMFLFYALSEIDAIYYPIAMTLAFSVCGLMFLYSGIFYFLNKK
jgi:uncharacterized membrane protein